MQLCFCMTNIPPLQLNLWCKSTGSIDYRLISNTKPFSLFLIAWFKKKWKYLLQRSFYAYYIKVFRLSLWISIYWLHSCTSSNPIISNHGGINVFLCEFWEEMYHAGRFQVQTWSYYPKSYIISFVLKISSYFLKLLSNSELLRRNFKILT